MAYWYQRPLHILSFQARSDSHHLWYFRTGPVRPRHHLLELRWVTAVFCFFFFLLDPFFNSLILLGLFLAPNYNSLATPLKCWYYPCWTQPGNAPGVLLITVLTVAAEHGHVTGHRHAHHHINSINHRDRPTCGQLLMKLPHQRVQCSSGENVIKG